MEEISKHIENLIKDIQSKTEKEILKELFRGMESVGCCAFIEQHAPDTGLDKVLVVKNMRSKPIETYKAAIGLKFKEVK